MKTHDMSPQVRDKLILALQMEEMVAAVNTALSVRKATLTIDYLCHAPMLLISMPGVEPAGWMITNTRARNCFISLPTQPDLRAIIDDIHQRLQKYNAYLRLVVDKKPNTRPRCKLQLCIHGIDRYAFTLFEAGRRAKKTDQNFTLPEKFQ